jgi:hypothetical protein
MMINKTREKFLNKKGASITDAPFLTLKLPDYETDNIFILLHNFHQHKLIHHLN